MSNLPERFTIPKDRIPKAWSQGVYNLCGFASITKVLEIINYVKTGTYTMMSKGYCYGRHSRPNKTQGGIDYDYAMESLLKHGTVPEEMFPYMNEIPDIIEDVMGHPKLSELDKEAEKTKIKGYVKIKGDIHFYDNVKKLLYEKQMPLVGNMVGKRHCTVIIGWDGNELLYHDHKGNDTIFKGRFNEAYYLDGGIDMSDMKFTDVKETDWYYEYINTAVDKGIVKGVTDTQFAPDKFMTRAEVVALICRALYGMG